MLFVKKKKRAHKAMIYCRVGTYEQMKGAGLRVVIYARSSTRKELKSQVRKLVDYCERNRFVIVAIKTEVGNGKSHFRTPLNSVMKNKEAQAMVITELSRFSRDMPLGLQLLRRVYENNKFLISADADKVIYSSCGYDI